MNKIACRARMMLLSAMLGPLIAAHSYSSTENLRDPFHPVVAVPCSQVDTTPLWRLKGVMGRAGDWVGWLAQPDSPWLKLKQGEAIPSSHWQVSQLDKLGMKLTLVAQLRDCDGQATTVSLTSPFINLSK